MEKYDLIVIGAGPGGYVAAIRAAQLGKRVAVIEDRDVGGTCLNRGCIPTKTLVHTAEVLEELKTCDKIGIDIDSVTCDFARMHERKGEVVAQLRGGVENLFKANKIDLIRGKGFIADSRTVTVGEERYEADHILIATGSRPLLPPIPGLDLEGVVTSDDMLEGSGVDCDNLVIIGGGVIGVEFASVYHALGRKVTIIEAMERILPTLDKEISQNMSMLLKRRGVQVFTGARVSKVEKGEDGLIVRFTAKDKEQSVDAERVLVSIGRRANTEGLLAEGMDLGLERGLIPVDAAYKTCIDGIYAIGDVIKGGIQLAHAASAEGVNAVCGMFGEKSNKNLEYVPSCIYTSPEIASVGITADMAKAQDIPVITGKAIMTANGKTIIAMGDRGFIKLIFHAETKELLGAQLMCERATDMLGSMTEAVCNHLTLEQMSAVIWPHPTFSEAIGEALEDLEGGAIHAAPRRK